MDGACTTKPCIAPSLALSACAFMAFLYVAMLYAPSLLLRLPPPSSLLHHMLRRFASATISSLFSLFLSSRLLPMTAIQKSDLASWLHVYGLRSHHWWQAVVFPFLLTALLYLGPLMAAALEQLNEWHERLAPGENPNGVGCSKHACWDLLKTTKSFASDILAWRNFVVAPLTEEIVFRACMIPILLCAGFQHEVVIFLCPLFFGLAHLNHLWELIYQQRCGKKRAFLIVGLQLGYTTVFGWYASFLYLRTGNLLAPLAVHIFCNVMGLPDLDGVCQKGGLIVFFVTGIIGFCLMLAPASNPYLYNEIPETCNCWFGYCKWR